MANKNQKYRVLIRYCLLLLIVIGSFPGCGKESTEHVDKPEHIFDVKVDALEKTLHFNGVIKPIAVTNIISPVEGFVEKLNVNYGDSIKKQAPLLTLKSSKIEEDFQTEVTNYLKAMDDYNDKVRKFQASEELWNLKFIPKNDYIAEQNAKNESYISYMQSKRKLEQMMEKLGFKENIEEVNFENYRLLEKVLLHQQDNLIIRSIAAGVVLIPEKSTGVEGGMTSALQAGSQVKAGDVIFAIGDLTSLAVNIDVDELDVNQIKVGQTAAITGPGFADITLKGYVKAIQSQAKNDSNTAPVFLVTLVVPELPADALTIIHVGMSAKVTLKIKQPEVILIPIAAVHQKNGENWVNVKDKVTGTLVSTRVVVGETTLDSVKVYQGLSPGDRIVYSR
jgi:multidrug efflux pump subunit AcrA (membrane-fusion protein)